MLTIVETRRILRGQGEKLFYLLNFLALDLSYCIYHFLLIRDDMGFELVE